MSSFFLKSNPGSISDLICKDIYSLGNFIESIRGLLSYLIATVNVNKQVPYNFETFNQFEYITGVLRGILKLVRPRYEYEKVKTAISLLSMHTLYSRSKIGHKFGNHQFMIYFQLGTSFYLYKPFFIT